MSVVGIDLGTSHCALAALDDDGQLRVLGPDGVISLPAVVWYAEHQVLVGNPALPGLEAQPEQTLFGIKGLLGRAVVDPVVQRLGRVLPFSLGTSPCGDVVVALGDGRRVTPEEVVARLLRELRRLAQAPLGAPVTEAVVAVPLWFGGAQRQAVRAAATLAGLEVRRLISEPIAVALANGLHRSQPGRRLLCDLGGGTFDAAVVDHDDGVIELRGGAADPFLGGDDADRAAAEQLARDVRHRHGVDVTTDATAIDRLRLAAQRAKHALSTEDATGLEVPHLLGEGRPYARAIRRDELDAWITPLTRRLAGPVREALTHCGVDAATLAGVVLAGGMSRVPAIQAELARVVGRPITVTAHPERGVAHGAALLGSLLAGELPGVLLLERAPRSVALSVGDAPPDVVVAEGSPVPIREHRVLATTSAAQRRLEFDLWESEGLAAETPRHLARYALTDLPEAPAGQVLVVVDVTIDVDGTAHIAATELASGQRPAIEVVLQAGPTEQELARLAQLFAAEVSP